MENRLLSNAWNTSYFLTFRFQSNYSLQRKCSSARSMSSLHPTFLSTQSWCVSVIEHIAFKQLEYLSNMSKSKCISLNVYLRIEAKFLESRDHVPIIQLCTPSIYPNAWYMADDQLIWWSVNIQWMALVQKPCFLMIQLFRKVDFRGN